LQTREYLSADSVLDQYVQEDGGELYTQELLNATSVSGLPPHRLCLKVGMPIMLLRNMDKTAGLANGTILQIKELQDNVVYAAVLGGKYDGTATFIPRMNLQVSETNAKKFIPLARRQFPIRPAFAMTINKSQGQTLRFMGLYLPQPVFDHGQFYVSTSRVGTEEGCRVLVKGGRYHGFQGVYTRNIVYKEALLPME
jgi:ATP-dependent DNA helicase PIF1